MFKYLVLLFITLWLFSIFNLSDTNVINILYSVCNDGRFRWQSYSTHDKNT